jgi:indole-3-glycerol phosphate synthase
MQTHILDSIVQEKQGEVEELRRQRPSLGMSSMKERTVPLREFLSSSNRLQLIAEVKKASPSRGVIRQEFDPIAIAQEYAETGLVDALSVLTDRTYFQGDLGYIERIKEVIDLPVLRKDFIIDESQIYESYVAGADAILLIVRILTQHQLSHFLEVAHSLGMAVLVETHALEEVERALRAGAAMIGVNSRDLKTFKEDKSLFSSLVDYIPQGVMKIAESGIITREDVETLQKEGAHAVLVGTVFMQSPSIGEKVYELFGKEEA